MLLIFDENLANQKEFKIKLQQKGDSNEEKPSTACRSVLVHEHGANELLDHIEQQTKSHDLNKSLHLEDKYSELGAPEVLSSDKKVSADRQNKFEEIDLNEKRLAKKSDSINSSSDEEHLKDHKGKNYALFLEAEEKKVIESVQLKDSHESEHLEEPYYPNSEIGNYQCAPLCINKEYFMCPLFVFSVGRLPNQI